MLGTGRMRVHRVGERTSLVNLRRAAPIKPRLLPRCWLVVDGVVDGDVLWAEWGRRAMEDESSTEEVVGEEVAEAKEDKDVEESLPALTDISMPESFSWRFFDKDCARYERV